MNEKGTDLKRRSLSIDMVKGLSIMTLFYLHFENGWINPEYNFFIVRSPAFYIVVGWLWGISSNKKTIKGHWEKRKNGLIKPYLLLSLIFIAFDAIMVMLQFMDAQTLERDIFKTVSLRGIGTLWFLPALLGGEMLFIYLNNKNKYIKIPVYILCFAFIVVFNKYIPDIFPHNRILQFITFSQSRVIKDVCDTFIYITIAYHISRAYGKKIFYSRKIYQFFIGITLLFLAFCLFNFPNEKYIQSTSINILFFMIANCCSSFGILLFFKSVEQYKFLSIPLSYCGKNSLIIMAFHFCLLFQLTLIIDKEILGYIDYCGDRTIIYFIIALMLQIAIIEIINKKFRFVIGKN